MPKKTKKPVLKQTSIKKLLKKKVSFNNIEVVDDIDDVEVQRNNQPVSIKEIEVKKTIIPYVFNNPNDITQWQKPYYKVSNYCVSAFRYLTNFEDVEDKKLYHGDSLVSTIISKPAKRLYCPILNFKYKSAKDEHFLKTLAMLPNIKCKRDLKLYYNFGDKHGLKECYVNMCKNNPAKEYSDQIIANFKKTNSDHRVWKVMKIMNHEVLSYHYKSKNIQREKLFAVDFTLETMLQYSNLEWIAKQSLAEHPYKSQDLQFKLKHLFYIYKYIKSDQYSLRHLKFNPYYEVIDDYYSEDIPPHLPIDDAQPSTSKSVSFEFKKKPRVGTKSDNKTPFSEADIDLTTDGDATDIMNHKEDLTTCYAQSQPEIVEHKQNEDIEYEKIENKQILNEIYDDEEEDTLEDKLGNIVEFLTADKSSSFLICVRDWYQTQKYLTQTHWRLNLKKYVYDFLKSNISLDILNYIKKFDSFSKDTMTYLINDYLAMKKRQETPETPETPETLTIEYIPTDLIQTEIIKADTSTSNSDTASSMGNTSIISLNKDPLNSQIKLEKIVEEESTNSYSEIEFIDVAPDEIIEIDSDSESNLCDDLNNIDDTIAKSNSDIYLKSAEQGDTQETLLITNATAATSINNDSKLESYNSITYQDHVDDQQENKKRKMTINTIDRIQSSMDQPSAKLVANIENISLRKNPNIAVMTSKPSSRNIYLQDNSSDEILQPQPQSGNIDFLNHIDEVLNHEYSVFLSSQIIGYGCEDDRESSNSIQDDNIKVPSINYTNPINSDVNILNQSAACFFVNIVGVKFQKDVLFHVTLNIPQFNFFSIELENENIKTLLNLNPLEWTTLKDLLNLAVTYIYVKPKKDYVRISSKTNSNNFSSLLDKFFDTATSFKTFYLNSNDSSLICYDAEGVSSYLNVDLSTVIKPCVLEKMKRLKATGSTT